MPPIRCNVVTTFSCALQAWLRTAAIFMTGRIKEEVITADTSVKYAVSTSSSVTAGGLESAM
jgi:hypothetical protein